MRSAEEAEQGCRIGIDTPTIARQRALEESQTIGSPPRMTGNELRDEFLRFFAEKGHKVLPSYPLVLPEDPTTLFTVAGMQPFSPVFRGESPAPAPRVATSQKVFREGDLDIVGLIGRYHTFYEMLGNFSFGDYFKREAIEYAWEFVTKVMNMPPEHLWFTVYEEDDEAARVWEEVSGLGPDRVVRLGKKDNWWPQNAWDGPCGPCSEIYLDRGEKWGCGKPDCRPGCDCDRYLEFWNLVFQMYVQDSTGKILANLPHPGIDTGMGLERAACLVMGVGSNYETDLIIPVIQRLVEVLREDEEIDIYYTPLAPEPPGKDGSRIPEGFSETDSGRSARLRSIADHVRAASFLIADGVLPGSTGRGSVLRRLIRRSFGNGWRLGVRNPFLHKCVIGVVRALGHAYPEIVERQAFIETSILTEEDQFQVTVQAGMLLLQAALERHSGEKKVVDGQTAFALATTHGFPGELTRDVAAQYGFQVDWPEFDRLMDEFRLQSKDPSRVARGQSTTGLGRVRRTSGATRFTGYSGTSGTAAVLALVRDGEDVETLTAGQFGTVVLEETPFYAESGGQVGDIGALEWDGGLATVENTTKLNDLWLHQVKIEKGSLAIGSQVDVGVDLDLRQRTMKNHTATHLLHAALHRVLGKHATQAGSLVSPDRLRFDFTHGEPVRPEQLAEVERIVEDWINADLPVVTRECSQDEARAAGAMALFGEKYGDQVRMVRVGEIPISLELCGGTHVSNTGVIGLFHVTSETGIGSGLRRIEAVTGPGAAAFFRARNQALEQVADTLRCAPEDASDRVSKLQQQVRDLQKQRDSLLTRGSGPSDLVERAIKVGEASVVSVREDGLDGEALGKVADQAISRLKSGVVVMASAGDGKVLFVAKVSQDLVKKGVHAGQIVKALATRTGGGGGGRPEFAQAGGRSAEALDDALAGVPALVEEQLGR